MNDVSKLAWKLSPAKRSLLRAAWDDSGIHMFEVRYLAPSGDSKSICLYTEGAVSACRSQADAIVQAMKDAFEAGQQSVLLKQAVPQ
jgi:hypothetical protein